MATSFFRAKINNYYFTTKKGSTVDSSAKQLLTDVIDNLTGMSALPVLMRMIGRPRDDPQDKAPKSRPA